jgi:hypothetical protein
MFQRRGEVALADIGGWVHGSKNSEARMTRNGRAIAALGEHLEFKVWDLGIRD